MKTRKMTLFITFPSLLLCGCGEKENPDYKLVRAYIEKNYESINMSNFTFAGDHNTYVTDSMVDGLQSICSIHYSFSAGAGLNVERKSTTFSTYTFISPKLESLKKTPVSFSLFISYELSEDGWAKSTGTLNAILNYEAYTEYFPWIYDLKYYPSDNPILDHDANISKNKYSYDYTSQGHYYYKYSITFEISQKKVIIDYHTHENNAKYGPYNKKDYSATYYFDENPRIEGLESGTYFIGNEFTSDSTFDKYAYDVAKKTNGVFKFYEDTRFITQIS